MVHFIHAVITMMIATFWTICYTTWGLYEWIPKYTLTAFFIKTLKKNPLVSQGGSHFIFRIIFHKNPRKLETA